jgi:hypothetical protein
VAKRVVGRAVEKLADEPVDRGVEIWVGRHRSKATTRTARERRTDP